MLGSPPKPPRLWPEPPPAHTHGLDRFLYSVKGDGQPRLAHIQQPSAYPFHKVEEQLFTSEYTRSVSQVRQVITEESSKLTRKEICPCKPISGWSVKNLKEGGCSRTIPRGLLKSETATTPCQVQEVTTSSKTDISGNNSGGIPVGIAIARQRVQQSAPSPLTVVTCQDRTTTQVPSWPMAPPHWQFAPTGNGMDQTLPIQQFVVRDPMTGQLMLLQGSGLEGGMQRAMVWPGNNVAPSMQVMQAPPQPVLLSDRLVTLAPQQQMSDKRRQIHDPVTGVMFPCELTKNQPNVGPGSQGLILQPTLSPQQFSSVLIQQMPFATATSHHNNSLLLSTQVAEHSLINQNLVISNHLENTVINPQIIGMENGGFGQQSGLLHHMHPSLVISHHHTETNFMRQDITPVLSSVESPVIVKQEIKTETESPIVQASPPHVSDDSKSAYEEDDEGPKTIVQDASNQTETPVVSDEEAPITKVKEEDIPQEMLPKIEKIKDEVPVKIEVKEETQPDLSGLELLSNSIAQHEKIQVTPEREIPQKPPHYGGLGLLCEVAANLSFAEDSPNPAPSSTEQPLNLSPKQYPEPSTTIKSPKPLKKLLTLNLKVTEDSKETPPKTPTPPILSPLETKIPIQMPLKKVVVAKVISEPLSPDTTVKLLPKKRPGRPKKPIKFDDIQESDEEKRIEQPPVLEPWSALPKQKVSSIPPTLTPHKKRKSFENIIIEEADTSFKNPPPLSPPTLVKPPHKKKLLKELAKQFETPEVLPSTENFDEIPKSRIRPKLKAEAKVKSYNDDDELEEIAPVQIKETPKTPVQPLWRITEPQMKKQKTSSAEKKKVEKQKVQKVEEMEVQKDKEIVNIPQISQFPDCKLAEERLNSLPCNIMMAKGGLFYTGQITEAKAEGIYEVVLEKERHRKPHIMCSEELINDTILEVKSDGFPLPTGTRLCAYWSQQYNCLYPGSVCGNCGVEDKFVNVEFDDGDNGTICRDDIRLLPQDYPTVEYDPNPLSSLGKRKRLSSTTSADGKSIETHDVPSNHVETVKIEMIKNEENDVKPPKKKRKKQKKEQAEPKNEELNKVKDKNDEDSVDKNFPSIISSLVESEQERKRIKKEKKRKMLENGGKLRKHKHRDGCHTHHKRKHKHHRKHKHKHSSDKFEKEKEEPEEEKIEEPIPEPEPEEEPIVEQEEIQQKKPAKKNASKSKIAAFLPERHEMWVWKGDGVKRGRALGPRGKGKKIFYKSIQRGSDIISVGDCAVFVSTGRPDRPFIGKIESLWATIKNSMAVKVSWFYHPEEAIGAPEHLNYPGGLFESPHNDCNDVQTISHKCEVVPLDEFLVKVKEDPEFLEHVYENQETYYLAGHYDPHNETINFETGVYQ